MAVLIFMGIFLKFGWVHLISFGLIWCALILFTLSSTGLLKSENETVKAA